MNYIGVIGAGVSTKEDELYAYEIGKNIGENDKILVCGGMGGVMEAATKGCYEAGGVSFGILPGHNRNEGNSYLTYCLPTGMGEMRNFLVVRFSDVIISVSGGYGTLSEMAISLKEGKKIISLNPKYDVEGLIKVTTPKEAIEKAFQ